MKRYALLLTLLFATYSVAQAPTEINQPPVVAVGEYPLATYTGPADFDVDETDDWSGDELVFEGPTEGEPGETIRINVLGLPRVEDPTKLDLSWKDDFYIEVDAPASCRCSWKARLLLEFFNSQWEMEIAVATDEATEDAVIVLVGVWKGDPFRVFTHRIHVKPSAPPIPPKPEPPVPDPVEPGKRYIVIVHDNADANVAQSALLADIEGQNKDTREHLLYIVDDDNDEEGLQNYLNAASGKPLPQIFLVDFKTRRLLNPEETKLPDTFDGYNALLEKYGG